MRTGCGREPVSPSVQLNTQKSQIDAFMSRWSDLKTLIEVKVLLLATHAIRTAQSWTKNVELRNEGYISKLAKLV
jgi:hypothetical protein